MGTVLPGGEAAEVIPFDYDAPVLYYPVRHHSPACAWHLEQAMKRYRPELVLVEGPENANDLIPIDHLDPYSGFPGYKQVRCAVKKV